MNEWLDDLAEATRQGACVLVTVAGVRGSAPRETGARMIVTRDSVLGTIGGGQLEYQCTRIAAEQMLREGGTGRRRFRRRFPLGSNCGQCCGGVVDVMFERVAAQDRWWIELAQLRHRRCPAVLVTPDDADAPPALITADDVVQFPPSPGPSAGLVTAARNLLAGHGGTMLSDGFLLQPVVPTQFNIAVFGAGHVGTATVDLLAKLDCRLRWIDGRRGIFPRTVPRNVTLVESAAPAQEVAAMPAGTCFLVMTHSHPLDLEICGRVLARADAAYCGLIGSLSKRRRFERELRKQGIPEAALARLTCPIGIAGITSKRPADIAMSVGAELLRIRDALAALHHDARPLLNDDNVRAI